MGPPRVPRSTSDICKISHCSGDPDVLRDPGGDTKGLGTKQDLGLHGGVACLVLTTREVITATSCGCQIKAKGQVGPV